MKLSFLFIILIGLMTQIQSKNVVLDYIRGIKDKEATEISNRVFNRIDKIENVFGTAWKWTRSHRQLVKVIIGGFLLLYGGHFTNTIVFYQAISVTCLPILSKSLQEFSDSYRATRNALKEELPSIIKAEGALADMMNKIDIDRQKLKDLEQQYNLKTITKVEYDMKAAELLISIASMRSDIRKFKAVKSSFAHLKEAMDPGHLQVSM